MATEFGKTVVFQDLGTMEYKAAWDLQESLLQGIVAKKSLPSDQRPASSNPARTTVQSGGQKPATDNYLLFVEHPPVLTIGKSGKMENMLISEQWLASKGIGFFRTNRGGDITFHGPEQIVGYPILDLENFFTDIGKYLRCLEEVIILTMADYGLKGERSPGETGVWIDTTIPGKARKICAIGVRCSRWVTMHGFAFNVNTDLSYFNYIIPCGIQNKQVTSLQKEIGHPLDMEEVKDRVKRNFEKVFEAVLTEEEFSKVFRDI